MIAHQAIRRHRPLGLADSLVQRGQKPLAVFVVPEAILALVPTAHDVIHCLIRRGGQSYAAEQATASSGPWTQCYVGKASKCTATGLTSGTQYWFQVRAIGAAGPSAWSDPATKRAT